MALHMGDSGWNFGYTYLWPWYDSIDNNTYKGLYGKYEDDVNQQYTAACWLSGKLQYIYEILV